MRASRNLSRPCSLRGDSRPGFTLLELIVAFTILTLFILPILEIVAASRVRAVKYTRERVVQDLAQRKIFERIYYLEEMDSGTFEREGYPSWRWEVLYPPEIVDQGTQGKQVLLQYTIRVFTPQSERAGIQRDLGGEQKEFQEAGAAFEMSVWTFPSQEWYEDEELQNYYDTEYYGGFGGVPGDW